MLKASNILTLGTGRKLIESWFLRKLEVIVTNPMGVTTLTQACMSSKQCLNILYTTEQHPHSSQIENLKFSFKIKRQSNTKVRQLFSPNIEEFLDG